jgi:hypothetical protein
MKPKLLTVAAELAEDLTEEDYRCIYSELREKCSLRAFAEFIHSEVSHAWWGRYENQLAPLNHERRNELRRVVGLPELPWTVAQSLGNVSPNAAVWALGEQPVKRVVLVGADAPQEVTMRLNGNLTVIEDAHVMGLTRRKAHKVRKTVNVSAETWERLNTARKSAGQTWEQLAAQWAETLKP